MPYKSVHVYYIERFTTFKLLLSGDPRVVVPFTLEFRVCFPLTFTRETQYCGEPRGNVLGLTPPGFQFQILYLEGSVISLISPSSRGSPDPI